MENEYIDLILSDSSMIHREAGIAVTYRCNSKCSMCNIWKTENFVEIKPKEYLKLPKSLRTVNVTGGEPFLRKDLVDVLEAIHYVSPNARIVFSTNGYLTDTILDRIDEIRGFHTNVGLGVSIDGLEETHDHIRGVQGMFDKGIETIQRLKEMGLSDLRIAMTIQKGNADQVTDVYELSRRLGVEFSVTMAHNSKIYFKKTDNTAIDATSAASKQISLLMNSLLKSKSAKDWFRAYHVSGILDNSIRRYFQSRCEAGRRYVFIAPDGNVYPCNVMNELIGNLAEVSDWEGLYTSEVRERILTSVRKCRHDCWMVCNTRSLIIAHPFRSGSWVLRRKVATHLGCNE